MPILLALNCHCANCLAVAQAELGPSAGHVCGHYSLASRKWHCVYCGGVTQRRTSILRALFQSAVSELQTVRWELGLGEFSSYRLVRWYARR